MQITIIGGGSYQWTPELLADLLGTESLRGAHYVLEDIDPAPLAKMEALAGKVGEALGARATFATTTDQRRALDGADFVIVTISTGGFDSMAVDLDVPARYGIRQSVGDTVGPGGINRSLRNIPVLVGVGEDMGKICPDAWLLNITNPMTCLTRAVCRQTAVKTVGLCHEVGNWTMDLAIALGKPARGGPRRRWPASTTSRWSPPSTSTARTAIRSSRRWWPRPAGSPRWPPVPTGPRPRSSRASTSSSATR